MDVRQLRNMLAVLEDGSLAKAALRVNLSQPALTKSIQRLEKQLGVRLFERDPRGMIPTLYASGLRNYAQAVCASLLEAEQQIEALRSGHEGAITIAAPPLIMTSFVPSAVARLSQHRPKLQISLVSQTRNLYADLLDGHVGLVVSMLFDEIPKRGLVKQWLFDDRLVLVMRPDHPLTTLSFVEPKILLNQKWIFARDGNWGQSRLRVYFEQHGLDLPRSRIESHDHVVMKSIIMASDHIGLIAKLGVEREILTGALACIEIDSPLMGRPIGIVRRENEPTTPATDDLIGFLKDAAKERGRNSR